MICETGIDWKRRVCLRGCILQHEHGGPLQAHHVITQQQLRKHGLHAHRWDTRNGVPVCERGHSRHTLAVERIPYERLTQEALTFAATYNLMHLIERYYPRGSNGSKI